MELTLKSSLMRRLLALVEAVIVAALVVWISKTYFASRSGRQLNAQDLQTAARLDPGNSDYHLMMGRLAQYNVADMNPDLAMESLRRAAELNPRDPQPWLELAAAYGFQGKNGPAEACLRRADFLAPSLPSVQWVIGNFFLLRGENDEAFRHFRVVLSGSNQYNQTLFKIAWKAADDGQKILEGLIPDRVPIEIDYLYFLMAEKHYPEAMAVWKRIAASGESFAPTQVSAYIDQLIVARYPAEAHEVWDDLKSKSLVKPTYEASSQNLLVNADFEDEILNLGFDWRIRPVEGVYVGLDGSNYHSPGHALLIRFTGKTNLGYRLAYQFVPVEPGQSYRLRGFLKGEGITTDSGPRLSVHDAYDIGALQKLSEMVTGSTVGWTQIILDFTTGPKTELIMVSVARLPSSKIDNQIDGKVWVDDLSLVATPREGTQPR